MIALMDLIAEDIMLSSLIGLFAIKRKGQRRARPILTALATAENKGSCLLAARLLFLET